MHKGLEGNARELGTRRAVAQMERADLEDKHLNLMEENLVMISPMEFHYHYICHLVTKEAHKISGRQDEAV